MNDFVKEHKRFLIVAAVALVLAIAYWPQLTSNIQGGTMTESVMGSRDMAFPNVLSQKMMAPAYESPPMMDEGIGGGGPDYYDASSESKVYIDPMPPVPGSDQGIASEDRMIIQTGSLTVEVEKPEETFKEVEKYVESVKGFIENSTVSESYYSPPVPMYEKYDMGSDGLVAPTPGPEDRQKQVSASIRVPADKFTEAMNTFRAYGYVSSENTSGQDVTATYQDTNLQLENLKGRAAKLQEFYTKAKNVEETLQVFKELESLRYQIEQLESQKQNLERQTGFATIYLNLTPKSRIEPFTTGEWNVGKVWKEAVNTLTVALRGLAEAGVKIAVYSVIWIPLLLIIWIVVRIMKRKKG